MYPLISPLYRIEYFDDELPERLKPMLIMKKYLVEYPHLSDDIYFTAMIQFKKMEDITDSAMQEIYVVIKYTLSYVSNSMFEQILHKS